jgi:hypothetical protein
MNDLNKNDVNKTSIENELNKVAGGKISYNESVKKHFDILKELKKVPIKQGSDDKDSKENVNKDFGDFKKVDIGLNDLNKVAGGHPYERPFQDYETYQKNEKSFTEKAAKRMNIPVDKFNPEYFNYATIVSRSWGRISSYKIDENKSWEEYSREMHELFNNDYQKIN